MFHRLGLTAAAALALAFPALAEGTLNDRLPQAIRDAGVLRVVASSSNSPPMLFLGEDAKTMLGLEAELTAALAEVLGVQIEYTTGTFDSLIPAIAADRADIAVGSIGDLKARQEQVDFVDYVKAGIGMAVLAGNPKGITGLETICGSSVAVVRGTFQEKELDEQRAKCEAEGSTLEVQTFAETNAAIMALRSERVDVWSGDSAPVGYAVADSAGAMELAGPIRAIAVLGYAVGKDDKELAEALKAGLEELVKNGTYQAIFDKWGQTGTMLEAITINDAWL